MLYLDTHTVVWLYAGDQSRFTKKGLTLINVNDLLISPIVKLELQYLLEIKRITQTADAIISDLKKRIGLKICQKPFEEIIQNSIKQTWTRDPFDRIIVAHAALDNLMLLSKDKTILGSYEFARW